MRDMVAGHGAMASRAGGLRALAAAGCCLLAMLLAACDTDAGHGDRIVVEVWQAFNPEETLVFKTIMSELEAELAAEKGQPVEIVIHYVSYGDMLTKLRTAAMAGMTPDVAFVDSIKVTDLAFGQALLPLDRLEPFRQRYGTIEAARGEFVRASFDAGVVNRKGEEHLYGLPVQTTTVALFWNRELFRNRAEQLRAAGLDPNRAPRDWEELIAYGTVLTDEARGVYGYGMSGALWFNFPIFNMYGVEFIRYDEAGRASAALAGERGRAALDRIRRIATSGAEGGAWRRSALFPDAGFINQKYAMILTGPWMVENFTNAGLDFDIALVPAPTPQEIRDLGLQPRGSEEELGPLAWSSSNVGGQTGVIMRTSQHPDIGFEILDRFTSEAVQRRWASDLGQLPVRLAAWPDLDTSKYPFLPKFMQQLALADRIPQIPLYAKLETDIFNPEIDLLLQRPGYGVETMLDTMERRLERDILSRINESIESDK